jgi:hypothetical protein
MAASENTPSQRQMCSASCRTTSQTKTPARSAWVLQRSDKAFTRAWAYHYQAAARPMSRCLFTAVALRLVVWLSSLLFSLAARSSRLAARATFLSSRLLVLRRPSTTTTQTARRRSASTRTTSSLVSLTASLRASRRGSAQRRSLPRADRSRTFFRPSTIVLMLRTKSVPSFHLHYSL